MHGRPSGSLAVVDHRGENRPRGYFLVASHKVEFGEVWGGGEEDRAATELLCSTTELWPSPIGWLETTGRAIASVGPGDVGKWSSFLFTMTTEAGTTALLWKIREFWYGSQ